jgi:hypothetical protein
LKQSNRPHLPSSRDLLELNQSFPKPYQLCFYLKNSRSYCNCHGPHEKESHWSNTNKNNNVFVPFKTKRPSPSPLEQGSSRAQSELSKTVSTLFLSQKLAKLLHLQWGGGLRGWWDQGVFQLNRWCGGVEDVVLLDCEREHHAFNWLWQERDGVLMLQQVLVL